MTVPTRAQIAEAISDLRIMDNTVRLVELGDPGWKETLIKRAANAAAMLEALAPLAEPIDDAEIVEALDYLAAIEHGERDTGIGAHTTPSTTLVKHAHHQLHAAIAQERELCCKAVCENCKMGMAFDANRKAHFTEHLSGRLHWTCKALAIRAIDFTIPFGPPTAIRTADTC